MSTDDYNFDTDTVFGGVIGNLTGTDALTDIKQARARLGEFTLRFAYEAIYGDEITRQILGEDGGNNIKLKDLKVSVTRNKDGSIVTKLDEAQIKELFPNEKPGVQKQTHTNDQQSILTMMTKMTPDERSTLLRLLKKEG